MNNEERQAALILTIKAIEEYLNNHQFELERTNVSNLTSQYFILNAFKDDIIKEVYNK